MANDINGKRQRTCCHVATCRIDAAGDVSNMFIDVSANNRRLYVP